MEYRAVKEKRSLLKNISASWDIISLGGNVLKFRGGVDQRDAQLGKLSAELAAKVETGDMDPVIAEDEMSRAARPQSAQEAMLTDPDAEKASIRLSRLAEGGHVDPVVAEDLLNSGFHRYTTEKTLEHIKRKRHPR